MGVNCRRHLIEDWENNTGIFAPGFAERSRNKDFYREARKVFFRHREHELMAAYADEGGPWYGVLESSWLDVRRPLHIDEMF
jgi:hypothetical protein